MSWIEPLELETWIISVFSGDPEIFTAIALLVISSMAGYFRMNTISLFFMIGVFLLMFSGYISASFLILISIIGGLVIGYFISRIFQ
jgi:ABC-type multidrug transport system permease subunit